MRCVYKKKQAVVLLNYFSHNVFNFVIFLFCLNKITCCFWQCNFHSSRFNPVSVCTCPVSIQTLVNISSEYKNCFICFCTLINAYILEVRMAVDSWYWRGTKSLFFFPRIIQINWQFQIWYFTSQNQTFIFHLPVQTHTTLVFKGQYTCKKNHRIQLIVFNCSNFFQL